MRRNVTLVVLLSLVLSACVMGARGAMSVAMRPAIGEASAVSLSRVTAVEAGFARGAATAGRATVTRTAGAGALTAEARVTAAARSGQLSAFLDELALTRPVVDAAGRVTVGRTAVAVIDELGTIRATSGEVLGRIAGSRIVAARSATGAGTEIGEIVGRSLAPNMRLDVTVVRSGWYRVALRPHTGNGALTALAAVAAAHQDSSETPVTTAPSRPSGNRAVRSASAPAPARSDLDQLVRAANEAGDRRFRAGIRDSSPAVSRGAPAQPTEVTDLHAAIESHLRND